LSSATRSEGSAEREFRSVVFVADGLAAMSVAIPVAVFGGTESRCGQQYKLFADGP